MHRAGAHLVAVLGPGSHRNTALAHALTASEAAALHSALHEDARDYFYSACSTLAAAIQGLNASLFTWSTVQLYYSVFYALRAELALRGFCIFYVNSSSMWVQAAPGAIPALTKENTHKSVLKVFESQVPGSSLLSQQIDADAPLEWLMAKRERANYGTACFPDPEAPGHFAQLERYGLRRLLTSYISDTTDAYTFDPDHAMLAFPIRTLGQVRNAIAAPNLTLSDDELAHLRKICRDSSGMFTQLVSLMQGEN